MAIHRIGLLALATALVQSTYADTANAFCSYPEDRLLWSSPAHGQVDVSRNASIVVLGVQGAPAEVLLNGVPVPRRSDYSTVFEPGPLLPDAQYLVTVFLDQDGLAVVEFMFHTEDELEPSKIPSPPEVLQFTAEIYSLLDQPCMDVLNAQECYDVGQNAFIKPKFRHVAAGWLILLRTANDHVGPRVTWPASCGDPIVFTHEGYLSRLDDVCLVARSIGASGAISEPTPLLCPPFAGATTVDGGTPPVDSGEVADEDAGIRTSGDSPSCTCARTRPPNGRIFAGVILLALGILPVAPQGRALSSRRKTRYRVDA